MLLVRTQPNFEGQLAGPSVFVEKKVCYLNTEENKLYSLYSTSYHNNKKLSQVIVLSHKIETFNSTLFVNA